MWQYILQVKKQLEVTGTISNLHKTGQIKIFLFPQVTKKRKLGEMGMKLPL